MTEQNKPHYKCPIIAAYMLECFDVHYIDDIGNHIIWHKSKPFIAPFSQTMAYGNITGEYFYIAPESLPILEPREGDMDNIGYIYRVKGGDYTGWYQQCNCAGLLEPHKSQTAFRDNKPFFWYEV